MVGQNFSWFLYIHISHHNHSIKAKSVDINRNYKMVLILASIWQLSSILKEKELAIPFQISRVASFRFIFFRAMIVRTIPLCWWKRCGNSSRISYLIRVDLAPSNFIPSGHSRNFQEGRNSINVKVNGALQVWINIQSQEYCFGNFPGTSISVLQRHGTKQKNNDSQNCNNKFIIFNK